MVELILSWINAEWQTALRERHHHPLIWCRPLRPYSLGVTNIRRSSVGLWSRGQHHGQDTTRHLFLGTQPPLFHKAGEPLETDSWLKTIESKFTLYPYNEGDKAGFTAQQLRSPARAWWDNHVAMFPAGTRFTWAEFKEAFKAHHVPAGVMRRKLTEFFGSEAGQQ